MSVGITVETDREEYRPGEEITGSVTLRAQADVEVRGVAVDLVWRTDGQGEPVRRRIVGESLWRGTMGVGESRTEPFSFSAPNGPFSYRGEVLQLEWVVEAVAYLPERREARDEAGLWLEGRGATGKIDHGPRFRPTQGGARQDTLGEVIGRWIMTLIFGLLGLCGVYVLFRSLEALLFGVPMDGIPILWLLFGLGVTVGAVGGGFLILGDWITERRFGKVEARRVPSRARPGETVTYRLRFQARRELRGVTARAELVGQEVVTRGRGKRQVTRRRPFHQESRELLSGAPARVRQTFDLEAEFTIPEEAPFTFQARHNAVEWQVEVRFEIPDRPDVVRPFPLVVST